METKEFKFTNGLNLRVPLTENETSWFVASDACEILALTDVRRAMERLDEDEKRKEKILSNGQTRELWLINEFGLYQLIMSSEKEEAREFKRWLAHEVLPTIRKEGKYTIEEANDREELIQTKVEQIERIEDAIKNINTDLNNKRKKLSKCQTELKDILKSDFRQYKINFSAEQV